MRECELHGFEHLPLGAPLEDLRHKTSAYRQHLHREIKRAFSEAHDAQMIGWRMARRVRCHIRQNQVGWAA